MKFLTISLFLSQFLFSFCSPTASHHYGTYCILICSPSAVVSSTSKINGIINRGRQETLQNLQKVIDKLEDNLKLQEKLKIQATAYEDKKDKQMKIFVDILTNEMNIVQ